MKNYYENLRINVSRDMFSMFRVLGVLTKASEVFRITFSNRTGNTSIAIHKSIPTRFFLLSSFFLFFFFLLANVLSTRFLISYRTSEDPALFVRISDMAGI